MELRVVTAWALRTRRVEAIEREEAVIGRSWAGNFVLAHHRIL
jgi:hypothetical protein